MEKLKKIDKIIGLFFAGILTFSFLALASWGLNIRMVNNEYEVLVRSNLIREQIKLLPNSDYVLQVKYDYSNAEGEVVFLNNKRLELRVSNASKDTIARYFYISKDMLRKADNILKIQFYGGIPADVLIKIKNYIIASEDSKFFFTLKGSSLCEKMSGSLVLLGCMFFLLILFLWVKLIFWGEKLFYLNIRESVLSGFFSFFPITLVFFILGVSSFTGPYAFVVHPMFLLLLILMGLVVGTFIGHFMFMVCLNFFADDVLEKRENVQKERKPRKDKIPEWFKNGLKWSSALEFSDKTIFLFMLMIILSVLGLIIKLESWAACLSSIGYCFLTVGVCIKVFKLSRKNI